MNTENLEKVEDVVDAAVENTPVNKRGLMIIIGAVVTTAAGIGIAVWNHVKNNKAKKNEVEEKPAEENELKAEA